MNVDSRLISTTYFGETPQPVEVDITQKEFTKKLIAVINSNNMSTEMTVERLKEIFKCGYKIDAELINKCKELYGLSREVEQFLKENSKV